MLAQANSKRTSSFRRIWRYRVPVVGLLALVLALVGEALQRTTPDVPPANPELGHWLVLVAVVLVGLVAWVRDDFPAFRFRRARRAAPEPPAEPIASVPVRRAVHSPFQSTLVARPVRSPQKQPVSGHPFKAFAARYVAFRQRLGWVGTIAGLVVVAGMGAAIYLLLSRDFSDPIAPWLWAGMLAMLALTFAGVPPLGDSLITHDPAEPREEPPVARTEWLLIALILLVAAVLRFWDLEHIPAGPYIDEADRALRARFINGSGPGRLEYLPFSFFSTDWWGVPTAYFWLVAQALKVFGDTLAGARTLHVLAGLGTVWYTYRTGRLVWSPRAGLTAAGLIAVSDFAIQFSRTAGESTITMFTWIVCFYYLYKGLKTMRPVYFVLSGVAGGLTLYGYASGKLLPPFMVLLAVYLLVRWGLKGARRLLPGLLLLALAAFLTFAPNALFVLKHPEGFTMRYGNTGIFLYQQQVFSEYNTNNWGVAIADQYVTTYKAFDVTSERGPFYPTHQPILPVPWAAIWVLGTAYVTWRLGDGRYAVLGAWLLAGFAGAAFTNDTPTLQRVAGMVPTLALIPALYLDRLASGLLALPLRLPHVRWRAQVARVATNAAIVALVLLIGFQTLTFYFGPYTATANYLEFTLEGRYAQTLDPNADILYQSGMPAFLGSQAPTYFLARDVKIKDFSNASDELPLIDNEGKNANLIFWPRDDPAISALQSLYPDGTTIPISNTHSETLFTVFRATTSVLDSYRKVNARYTPTQGQIVQREETRLGTLQPPDSPITAPLPSLVYPVQAEWQTSLVAPAYALYHFDLRARGGGSLSIDGKTMLTATPGAPAAVDLVLAGGPHQVTLAGTLPDKGAGVELRWSTGPGSLQPIARKFFWSGTYGGLLGRVYGNIGNPDMLLDPSLSFDAPGPLSQQPATMRRDLLLDWRDINAVMAKGWGLTAFWQGNLNIPADGPYLFDVDTDGMCSIFIDGKLVGGTRVPNSPVQLPTMVSLAAGTHRIEVRFQALSDHGRLVVLWQGPGMERSLLPTSALTPTEGGVWTRDQRPDAPIPGDDVMINPNYPPVDTQVSTVFGDKQWGEARGFTVLPSGGFVVSDHRAARIYLYDRNGNEVKSWGVMPNSARGFPDISDLSAAPDGTIASLDAANGEVQLYKPDAGEATAITRQALDLNAPTGLTLAPDGTVYIAGGPDNSILHGTRNGGQMLRLTGAGGSFPPLDRPLDVAVAKDGAIYAIDMRGRVVKINSSGKIEAEYSVPIGISAGGSRLALWGDLLAISNPEGHSISFLDPKSGQVTTQSFPASGTSAWTIPAGLSAGPDGKLYCLDIANNRVLALTR